MPSTSMKRRSILRSILAPSLLLFLLAVPLYQRIQGSVEAPWPALEKYADVISWITLFLASVCWLQSFVLSRAYSRAWRTLQEQDDRRELAELNQASEAMQHYAIFMLDPRGYVASWDRDGERLLGYKFGDAVGRHISIFYAETESRQGKAAHDLTMATLEGRSDDNCWMVRMDGFKFRASVSIVAIRDPDGSLCGFTNVIREHGSDASDLTVGSRRN